MKGFNTSTDYKLLWDLIHKGYRIPAWVTYDIFRHKHGYSPHFTTDICEVKKGKDGFPFIGVRGQAWGWGDESVDDFVKLCKSCKLEFIPPQNDSEPTTQIESHSNK